MDPLQYWHYANGHCCRNEDAHFCTPESHIRLDIFFPSDLSFLTIFRGRLMHVASYMFRPAFDLINRPTPRGLPRDLFLVKFSLLTFTKISFSLFRFSLCFLMMSMMILSTPSLLVYHAIFHIEWHLMSQRNISI